MKKKRNTVIRRKKRVIHAKTEWLAALVSVLDDITNTTTSGSPPQRQPQPPTMRPSQSATLNMRNQQIVQLQYIFHSCTVNIYHN